MLESTAKKEIEISIILRVKNEEKFIGRCLNAIFSQETMRPFEVVIVFDDTSSDNTRQLLKQYPVRIIRLQDHIERYTMPKAMNVGIKHAKGQILIFLSGDAIPMAYNWLEKLISGFVDETIAATAGRMVPRKDCYPMEEWRVLSTFPDEPKINWILPFSGCAIRKKILDEFPIREDLMCGEDKELKQRLIEAGYRIPYLPEAAVEHSHNMSIKRHYLIGMKRGQSYNMQGFLNPRVDDIASYLVFSCLAPLRLLKNVPKKVMKDYAYFGRRKKAIKWYALAWPYELAYSIGHYLGPLYYFRKYK